MRAVIFVARAAPMATPARRTRGQVMPSKHRMRARTERRTKTAMMESVVAREEWARKVGEVAIRPRAMTPPQGPNSFRPNR